LVFKQYKKHLPYLVSLEIPEWKYSILQTKEK
jgi:hypothetical protein